MKSTSKLLGLIILSAVAILFTSFFVVYTSAVTVQEKTLYVTSCGDDRLEWTTETNNPYLDDDDNSFIYEDKTSSMEVGDFGFADATGEKGIIDRVILHFECQNDDGDDGFTVYLDSGDGSSWASIGTVVCTTIGSYGWETIDIESRVDTWQEIDDLTMYLDSWNDGGGDDRWVRRVFVNVTYNVTKPSFSNEQINETGDIFSGIEINHSVTISKYPTNWLFSWNGTGASCNTWVNSSWISTSGESSATVGNVSEIDSNCDDKTIAWRFYANNSDGVNQSDLQYYNVSSYGTLVVDWHTNSQINDTDCQAGSPCSHDQNTAVIMNATITCGGGDKAKCGTVTSGVRYNSSGSTMGLINETEGGVPFYIIGSGEEICYQESATNATVCGGLNTGTYDCTGIWAPSKPCGEVFDESFSTDGIADSFQTAYMYVNYTKPNGANNFSEWEVKDVGSTVNLSLTQSCWDFKETKIVLRVESAALIEPYISWECFDGTNWVVLRNFDSEEAFEERILWNISGFGSNQESLGDMNKNDEIITNFTINITGTLNMTHLLDINFSSSYGTALVADNSTDDATLCIGTCGVPVVADITFSLKYPDDNFTISNSTGNISDVNFEYNTTDGQDKNVSACIVGNTIKCQTLSIGNYKFNNSGDTNIKWIAKLNETLPSSIEIWATLTSSAGTNVIPINDTVWAEINASISADAEEEAWFWVNFTDAVYADTIVIQIYHNSTEA